MPLKVVMTTIFLSLFLAKPALAHCPLCVAATGGAVVASRAYGVPDLITGTFVGAFVISIAAWIDRLLKRRNKFLPFQSFILAAILLPLFIVIFFVTGVILAIFDELVVGLVIGAFITSFAFRFNDFLREKNGNRNYVPFQIIIITLAFLLLSVSSYYFVGLI